MHTLLIPSIRDEDDKSTLLPYEIRAGKVRKGDTFNDANDRFSMLGCLKRKLKLLLNMKANQEF